MAAHAYFGEITPLSPVILPMKKEEDEEEEEEEEEEVGGKGKVLDLGDKAETGANNNNNNNSTKRSKSIDQSSSSPATTTTGGKPQRRKSTEMAGNIGAKLPRNLSCFADILFSVTEDEVILEPLVDESELPPLSINRKSFVIAQGATSSICEKDYELVFGLMGIIHLNAGPYLLIISKREGVGLLCGSMIYRVVETKIVRVAASLDSLSEDEKRLDKEYVEQIQELLTQVPLFFSYDADVTRSMQVRASHLEDDDGERGEKAGNNDNNDDKKEEDGNVEKKSEDGGKEKNNAGNLKPMWLTADPRFFWNRHLLKDLINLELHPWILPVIQGSVQIHQIALKGHLVEFALVSRRCCLRAGIRYQTRGIDPKGNVANFVETEQIVSTGDQTTAFTQIRGSIPIYWHQSIALKGVRYAPRPHVDRSTLDTVPAFRLHMEDLIRRYRNIVIVSLIDTEGDEWTVGEEFEKQIRLYNVPSLSYVRFDFHQHTKGLKFEQLSLLLELTQRDINQQRFLHLASSSTIRRQSGVIRTNCIDSLDRTNVAQSVIARQVLASQLAALSVFSPGEEVKNFDKLEAMFKNIWANNGDQLSLQYSGTGSLKNDFTRTGKRSVEGLLHDGVKSLRRFYSAHFRDEGKQDILDLFLGNLEVDSQQLRDSEVISESEDEANGRRNSAGSVGSTSSATHAANGGGGAGGVSTPVPEEGGVGHLMLERKLSAELIGPDGTTSSGNNGNAHYNNINTNNNNNNNVSHKSMLVIEAMKMSRLGQQRPCEMVLDKKKKLVHFITRPQGHVHTFPIDRLVQIESSISNPKALKMVFADTHPHEFFFSSVGARERWCVEVRSIVAALKVERLAVLKKNSSEAAAAEEVKEKEKEREKESDSTTSSAKGESSSSSSQQKQFTMLDSISPVQCDSCTSPFKVFAGTWNLSHQVPLPPSIERWIPREGVDLWVVAAQRCSYEPRGRHPFCESDWLDCIQTHLGADVTQVTAISLKHIRLAIWTRARLTPFVTNIEVATHRIGMEEVEDNACDIGAVSVSLKFFETSLCFLNVFLPIPSPPLSKLESLSDLIKTLKMGMTGFDISNQFHHFFVMGGLNFRIDLSWQEANSLFEAKNVTKLRNHDQLKIAREEGEFLAGFHEEMPSVLPSLRYGRILEKAGVTASPCWCDRILWRSFPNANMICLGQQFVDPQAAGDCAPIASMFELSVLLPCQDVTVFDTKSPPIIRITDMSANNLKWDPSQSMIVRGLSIADPYVMFRAVFMEKDIQSPVMLKTLNPKWKDPILLPCLPLCRSHLEHAHLFVSLFDHNSLRDDELLGQGVVSLRDAVRGEVIPWSINLSIAGRKKSQIRGNIQILFSYR